MARVPASRGPQGRGPSSDRGLSDPPRTQHFAGHHRDLAVSEVLRSHHAYVNPPVELGVGLVADDDLAALGHFAQPRGQVHGVAHGGKVHDARGADVADDRQTGVDAEIDAEPVLRLEAQVKIVEPLADLQRGCDRMQRVLGLGQRRVVEHHDAVTEKLVHRTLMLLHHFDHQLVILVENAEQFSRMHALGHAREALEVGEHDGHLLHLAAELHQRRVLQQFLHDLRRHKALERAPDRCLGFPQLVALDLGSQPFFDAGQQFPRVEGLGQVVVRADVEAVHAILRLLCKRPSSMMMGMRLVTSSARNRRQTSKPVEAGHFHVENDEIGHLHAGRQQGRRAVIRHHDSS